MKEVKLTVVGGGSSYTPELIDGLIKRWLREDFLVREIALVDVPEGKERMDKVASFASRMIEKQGMPSSISTWTDLRGGLSGTDFVISQIRVGGMRSRWVDEHVPLRYGVVGQETTGPGGFANALRTIPKCIDIAKEIEATCPKAWLLNFTNPSGIITEALLKHTKVRAFGLCNVPISIKMGIAQALEVAPEKVTMDVSGLNHLSFVTRVYKHGKDITDHVLQSPLLDAYLDTTEIGKEMAPFLKAIKVIPASYLYYYWARLNSIEKQKKDVESGKGTRADQVMKIEERLFEMYSDKSLDEMPPELKKRGGAFYSDVALNCISDILRNEPGIEILNVLNRGSVPGLPADAVVEVSCVIDGSGPKPIAQQPLPIEVLGLVQKVKAYEQLTIEAAVTGSVEKAFFALVNHPLAQDGRTAAGLLRDILEENKEFLPLFSGKQVPGFLSNT
jgi:6-phospho-beta-glucosidase